MAGARARFVVSDHVTDVGCRGFIISRILGTTDLKKGTAVNIGKDQVEVRLCGRKPAIESFYRQLKSELIAKYGNPLVVVGRIEYPKTLYVPAVERVANAHLLEQFDKGIDALSVLPGQLGRELGSQLGSELGHNLGQELGSKLGHELGQTLGQELRQNLGNELGQKLGRELGRELGHYYLLGTIALGSLIVAVAFVSLFAAAAFL